METEKYKNQITINFNGQRWAVNFFQVEANDDVHKIFPHEERHDNYRNAEESAIRMKEFLKWFGIQSEPIMLKKTTFDSGVNIVINNWRSWFFSKASGTVSFPFSTDTDRNAYEKAIINPSFRVLD